MSIPTSKTLHYQIQIVLVIAAVLGTYILKQVSDWPAWIYPMLAFAGIAVAGAREISQALDERDALAAINMADDKSDLFINEAESDGSLEFALEEAKEGIEILDQLIDSIQKHGNYSNDATLTFLGQARQCFNAIQRYAE